MNHLNVIEAPAVLNDEHHDEIKGKDVVPLKKKKKKGEMFALKPAVRI